MDRFCRLHAAPEPLCRGLKGKVFSVIPGGEQALEKLTTTLRNDCIPWECSSSFPGQAPSFLLVTHFLPSLGENLPWNLLHEPSGRGKGRAGRSRLHRAWNGMEAP